jgi:hypothetical protein
VNGKRPDGTQTNGMSGKANGTKVNGKQAKGSHA